MTPCVILPQVCTTQAKIKLFGEDLNKDGQTIIIWSGVTQGNFQMSFIQSLNGNNRTLVKKGTYLVPASYIPLKSELYCGGEMIVNNIKYFIKDIIPCFDAFGDLNYWEIDFE